MPVAMRLRALALHGFGQDAAVFEKKRTKDLQRRLKHLLTLSCIDAPLELPESAGQRCWWNYGPEAWDGLDKEALQLWATRPELLTSEKINAIGIDRTIEVLCDEWRSGGYDGVLGFSQGATAVAILCAKLLDAGEPLPKFAILISGPMLVPHDLPFYPPKAPLEVPSLHIRGMQDNIPSESVRALAALFEASNREFLEHGGGHFVPSKSSDVQVIEHFLERFAGQARSTDRAQLTLATSLVQSAEQDILDKMEADAQKPNSEIDIESLVFDEAYGADGQAKNSCFSRRDLLQQIEAEVQQKWEDMRVFECEADEASEKFMCTFPYPYMNGLLHIGHAFSLTKATFAAHFQRLLGKKVLFPFGFHCTGMPIQAAANKLSRELEIYGSPIPVLPAGRPQLEETIADDPQMDNSGLMLMWKPPASTGQKEIKCYHVLLKVEDGDFKKVATVPHRSSEDVKSLSNHISVKIRIESSRCVYKVQTELQDGSMCPESNESDELSIEQDAQHKQGSERAARGRRVAKKVQSKTGDSTFQWEILQCMGISADEIPRFVDPVYWLDYFPPLGLRDLKRFGAPVDFRRSFITTSANPFYDSFVRWHFRKLKASDKVGFGKRPTIFSEVDGQACLDHDRAEGEGVGPQEFTAVKIELLEVTPEMQKALPQGHKVFLLAATLRAETMPGQTNCWILPDGLYGCFQAGDKQIFVASHRAARNMSFQDVFPQWGKAECLMELKGRELIGKKVKAPMTKYAYLHVLPLSSIRMDKGTGIVTSVPSDSPDDYAMLMDLKKASKRDHFGVRKEWIEPFEPIPIIDVEIDGEVRNMAAQYMNEKLGVQSINDRTKLAEAHDICYKLGFDRGVMSFGPFRGQAVKTAKLLSRQAMITEGQAFGYCEPEQKVISRSGDECVVAGIDQWYLKYGEEAWRKQVVEHLRSEKFFSYNDRIKESFEDALIWLKEWACSRSFGLGTRVPWDEKFVIESLSDSTVYMAYYTVAHILQGKDNLDGCRACPGGVKAADLTDEVWDFVFLDGRMPENSAVPQEVLEKMRKEFRFWYPMDLRVSGKDLIQNHLTMSLYNHACVWEREPELWPRSFFCNGWLLVNNEKMSKSKGNFFTLHDIINKFSADACRLALANSGDTLEPANFDEAVCKKAVLNLTALLDAMKAILSGTVSLDEERDQACFVDRWFTNEMNRLATESKNFYEAMRYREALRTCYFELVAVFDQYRDICKANGIKPQKTLVMQYLEWQTVVLSPICPHFCEHVWSMLGKRGTVLEATYPTPSVPLDRSIALQGEYIFSKVPHGFIKQLEKATKAVACKSCVIFVAEDLPQWKKSVLALLQKKHAEDALPLLPREDMKSQPEAAAQWKEVMAHLMQDETLKPFAKQVGPFAAFRRDEAATFGIRALEAAVPFDEVALLTEHVKFLEKKLQLEVAIRLAKDAKQLDHQIAAGNAQPGQPTIHFTFEGAFSKVDNVSGASSSTIN